MKNRQPTQVRRNLNPNQRLRLLALQEEQKQIQFQLERHERIKNHLARMRQLVAPAQKEQT